VTEWVLDSRPCFCWRGWVKLKEWSGLNLKIAVLSVPWFCWTVDLNLRKIKIKIKIHDWTVDFALLYDWSRKIWSQDRVWDYQVVKLENHLRMNEILKQVYQLYQHTLTLFLTLGIVGVECGISKRLVTQAKLEKVMPTTWPRPTWPSRARMAACNYSFFAVSTVGYRKTIDMIQH